MNAEDLLVCPACKGAHLASPTPARSQLVCPGCGACFPFDDSVVELLPGVEHKPSWAQRTMEWEPIVRIYESRLWRRNPLVELRMGIRFEDEYRLIKKASALAEASRVLDLACGPGIYARRFARSIPEGLVVGLDLSRPMLAYAAERVREEGIDNLLLLHGDAAELPFESGDLDAVNCCGALHLFPDLPRVLAEVSRVLRAGGSFTAAVFRRSENGAGARISEAWNRYIGLQEFTPQSLRESFARAGLSEFQSLHASGSWLVAQART